MTQEILDDMRERQLIYNRESVEYQRKDREIKLKCKKVKEDWLQQRCKEIERTKETEPSSMFKRIKEVVGRRACSSSGCIKAKDGTIIMDKDKMLERWSEYIGELFEDNRQGRPVISCCLDGPKILKSEVREALKRMKKNKAAGPDEITIEHLTALEEFGIDRVTEIVNEIYDSGEIPVDM